MMRTRWVVCVGPKSNDKCPYKGQTVETDRRGDVIKKAELGVMQPQPRNP